MKLELTKKDYKKIALANKLNPYADIIPFKLGFGFPQINYPSFITQPDEFILYAAPAYTFTNTTKVTGFTGKTYGRSVQTKRGAVFHTGRYYEKPVTQNVKNIYNGDIIITNKRVVFIGTEDSFDYSIDKISAVKIINKSSFLITSIYSSRNVGADKEILTYILTFINYSIQAYKEGTNLLETQKALKSGISEEETALCNVVRYKTKNMKVRRLSQASVINIITAVLTLLLFFLIIFIIVRTSLAKDKPGPVTDKSIIELLTLPDHPKIYDNYNNAIDFYKNTGDSRIEVTTASKYARKNINSDKKVLYLFQDSSHEEYIGYVYINLYDTAGKEMTVKDAVRLITSYLPDYFGKYYYMTDCYKYKTNNAEHYVYAARLNDDGIAFHNTSAGYLSYYYHIKIIKYNDGEHWRIETGYSASGGHDKGWIEKYAEPWDINFAGYLQGQ